MKNLLLCYFLFSGVFSQVNFSEDISSIIYNNCTECHRPGQSGPMSFTNYLEVAGWGNMINLVTSLDYMPPWHADPEYSNFIGERFLTNQEKQLISDWVDGGMIQGNPSLEAEIPEFPEGSVIGEPDFVFTMEEEYLIEGNNQDDYRVFVFSTNFAEDKDLKSIEIIPGNLEAVHHVIISIDVEGECAALDAATPEYGYECASGFCTGNIPLLATGYAPGAVPPVWNNDIGLTLPAGADIAIQMHYAPSSIDQYDQTSVNLFFKDEPIEREIEVYTLIDVSLEIPADEIYTNYKSFEVTSDISLLSVFPHMHLIGKSWLVYAENDGDTIPIISIPDWDFNWQTFYQPEYMLKLPQGYTLHAYATYDNTSNNPLNPNSPPQDMFWCDYTTCEMFFLPFSYVPYQEGDENTYLGSSDDLGCTDPEACNYNPIAIIDDGSCAEPVVTEWILECPPCPGLEYQIQVINISGGGCDGNPTLYNYSVNGTWYNFNEFNELIEISITPDIEVIELFVMCNQGDYIDCSEFIELPVQTICGEFPELEITSLEYECGYNISCCGACDGAIDVTVTGGTGLYTYDWVGPNGFTSSDQNIDSLCEGYYSLTVMSECGDQIFPTEWINIIETPCLYVEESISVNECDYGVFPQGASNGAINLEVSGACPPYVYSWSGPNGFTSSEQNIDNLSAGTYNITVVDASECSMSWGSIEITEPVDNSDCPYGCTDSVACNYNPYAMVDDDSCEYPDQYYDCDGNCLNDTDEDGVCDENEIYGCTDFTACNYYSMATQDDGSCFYAVEYYDCDGNCLNDVDEDGICDEVECFTVLCMEWYECILGDCFCISDIDLDEVCDELDNCPDIFNPNQEDSNNDGVGDICDGLSLDVDVLEKNLIKITDLLGREVNQIQKTQVFLFFYENGEVLKYFLTH